MARMIDQDLVTEAFHEALRRYPDAADGLTFFYFAADLSPPIEPTPQMIEWAHSVAARIAGKAQG